MQVDDGSGGSDNDDGDGDDGLRRALCGRNRYTAAENIRI